MPTIYHFTDYKNLASVFGTRQLHCHTAAATEVDIGAPTIKSRRTTIDVPCGPGGKVCDYVPFYYAPRSPMLSSIANDNVPGVSPNQRRLIYFVSETERAYAAALPSVFTDGNAATAFTVFDDDRRNLDQLIDWPLMLEKYWRNTDDDPDRRRRRMAEFLVHRALPLDLVTEIAVYDERVAEYVTDLLASEGRFEHPACHPPRLVLLSQCSSS